jgi:hypothetical protein
MEKCRDLFPGLVGNGPEAQKGQTVSRGHLRQGAGFQVQNRLGQAGRQFPLASFMEDAAGGDQTAGDRREPRLPEGAFQEGQGPGERRIGAGLEFPGVGIIAPEGFSQDQIPGRQPRGQGAAESQRNQQVRSAALHQALPGPAGRRRPHPGQGHHPRARLQFPGRQSQVPAGPGSDPA